MGLLQVRRKVDVNLKEAGNGYGYRIVSLFISRSVARTMAKPTELRVMATGVAWRGWPGADHRAGRGIHPWARRGIAWRERSPLLVLTAPPPPLIELIG